MQTIRTNDSRNSLLAMAAKLSGPQSDVMKTAKADAANSAPTPAKESTMLRSGTANDTGGIPDFLKVGNRKPLSAAQQKKADARLTKLKADAEKKKPVAAKPAKPEKAAKAITAKTAPKRKSSERARYDWSGARDKAEKGTIPTAPDFSANTHRFYRPQLAEVVTLVKARDLKGLTAFRVKGTCSSPQAIKKYREIAMIALKAPKPKK